MTVKSRGAIAAEQTDALIKRYSGKTSARERALLTRMNPLDPMADWNAASVLYSYSGMRNVSGDNYYTPTELAVSVAVHLWARNTKSSALVSSSNKDDNDDKSDKNMNLGVSLRIAAGSSDIPPGFSRRFATVVGSKSAGTLYASLRALTALIESKGVRIDYPKLASDLAYVFTGSDTIDPASKTFINWNRGFWLTR